MPASERVFWVGSADLQCAKINGEVRQPNYEFSSDDIAPELLAEWKAKGLVSIGGLLTPVVIKDDEAIKGLEAEIRDLKAQLDATAGLKKENVELSASLEKATKGKKADALKELKQDIKEKDALIKKQIARIEELELDVAALTEPTAPADAGGNDSGGPA